MRNSLRISRVGSAIASLGILALVATGCGAVDQDPAASASASGGTPVPGGTLTLVQSGAINSWHPGAISAAQTFQRQQAVYDALLYVDGDETIQPGIAESLETEDDGKTWVLTLRPDVVFSDGAPFNAEAVKFNYDAIAEDGLSGGLAQSITTEIVDELHLKLTLEDSDPTLPYRIAEVLPFVASPDSLAERTEVYTNPVGAGPFVLVSSDSAMGEVFERNATYWDEGKPYIDELRTAIISDPAQRTLTVSQGGADTMNGYQFWFSSVEGNTAVRTESIATGGVRNFFFNMETGFFTDPRARQAAALAVNVDELVQTITQDPSQVGSSTMFSEGSVYHDAALNIPTGDLEKAQELFDEVAGSAPVTVKLAVPAAPENVRTAELLQLQLQQMEGLTVDLVQVPLSDWRTVAMDNDDFDIGFYPGTLDLTPVVTALPTIFGTDARENWMNFSDPDMDAAIARLRASSDESERIAAVAEVQRILVEQVPVVPFAVDNRTFLINSDLEGVTLVRPYIVLTQDVWIPQ